MEKLFKITVAKEAVHALDCPADQKRSLLKALLTDGVAKKDCDRIIKAMKASPLIGEGPRQLKKRATFTDFKDGLAPSTMIDIIANNFNVDDAIEAIQNPDGCAQKDFGSKTGHKFGWHKKVNAARIAEAEKHIRACAKKTTSSSGRVADIGDASDGAVPSDTALPNVIDAAVLSDVIDAVDIVAARLSNSKRPLSKHTRRERFVKCRESVLDTLDVGDVKKAAVKAASTLSRNQVSTEKIDKDIALASVDDSDGYAPATIALANRIGKSFPSFNQIGTDTLNQIGTDTLMSHPKANLVAEAVISEAFHDPLNSLLSSATGGQESDIVSVFKSRKDLTDQVNTLHKKLKAAKLKAAAKTPAKTRSVITSDGTIPGGKVVWKPAAKVFSHSSGGKLDFEIPCWEWESPHPDVPEADPHFVFDGNNLLAFLRALIQNKATWLHGMPGTGKSSFVKEVAARMGWPLNCVNMDANIERPEFVGNRDIKNDGGVSITEFTRGILPNVMEQPGFFMMDEADYVRPDIAYVMQRVLEGNGLALMEEGGVIVQPHEYWRPVATANTVGQGDELGCYPGSRAQSQAYLDRWRRWITFSYLKPAREAKLICDKYPDLDVAMAEKLTAWGKEMRTAFENGELIGLPTSPRTLFSIAEDIIDFSQTMDMDKAISLAIDTTVINRCRMDVRQRVKEITKRVLG